MMTLLRKFEWRYKFLFQPQDCFKEHTSFNTIHYEPLREAIFDRTIKIGTAKRLKFLFEKNSAPLGIDFWFRQMLKRDDNGSLFFQIGDRKLFFMPDYPVNDKNRLVEGTMQVLAEAFVRPVDFFSDVVRISPSDVVFDLGAHIGTSAMLFSSLTGPNGKVFSFEPVHSASLKRNLDVNRSTNVEVVACAVGDRTREIKFSVSDLGISSRIANTGKSFINVPMVSIDDFIKERNVERVDFIKMDIEGAEEMALEGARKALDRFKPCLSIASYHTDPEGELQHPKLVRWLKTAGYDLKEEKQKHIYAWKK